MTEFDEAVSDPGPDVPLSTAEMTELTRLIHEASQAEHGESGLHGGPDAMRRAARENAPRLASLRARVKATHDHYELLHKPPSGSA